MGRYALVAVERECDAVRTAPPGTRNNRLNIAAYNLGTLAGAGLVDRDAVDVALTAAGIASGLDLTEVTRTVASGLGTGVNNPRTVVPQRHTANGAVSIPTSPDVAHSGWATSVGEVVTGSPGAGADGVPRRSWRPEDLAPILAGAQQPPTPSVGARTDGTGVFYPGRVHSVASESEAGKTWLLLHCVVTELKRGNACVYLDFEDSAHGIVGRLVDLGVTADVITRRFAYIRPESPITVGCNRTDLTECMHDLRPTLVGVDGVTDAMAMHGLDLSNNTEIARFGSLLLRPMAAMGPAVVTLDHVTKDSETRSRYAIGGVHKLNGVDGAAYNLVNRSPFGRGVTGKSSVYVAKDRPGQLRRHCITDGDGHHYADLSVSSVMHVGEAVLDGVTLGLPRKLDGRPVDMMRRVADALAKAPQPLAKAGIEDRVTGNRDTIRRALAALTDEGFVRVDVGPRGALYHALVEPFTE